MPEFTGKALCHKYLLYLNKHSLDLLNNLLTQDKNYYMPIQSFVKQK